MQWPGWIILSPSLYHTHSEPFFKFLCVVLYRLIPTWTIVAVMRPTVVRSRSKWIFPARSSSWFWQWSFHLKYRRPRFRIQRRRQWFIVSCQGFSGQLQHLGLDADLVQGIIQHIAGGSGSLTTHAVSPYSNESMELCQIVKRMRHLDVVLCACTLF